MIELLLLAHLTASEPTPLDVVATQINESIEKPGDKTHLEVIINQFDTYCEGFYGCGLNYEGVNW